MTRCGNADCTAGNTSVDADAPIGQSVGFATSIIVRPNGLPLISHHNFTHGALRVTLCGAPDCAPGGNTVLNLDAPVGSSVGWPSSGTLGPDGVPVIAHRNNTTGSLRITRCRAQDCLGGHFSADVDTGGAGISPSPAIGVDGLPVISHERGFALRVTKCGTHNCQ